MKLHYNPLSSYSQKALTALHEKNAEFTPAIVDFRDPAAVAAYRALYPLGKVPLLVLDDGWMIPESTIIIEYLDAHIETGTRLIPADKDQARRVRFLDRQADLYLNDKKRPPVYRDWLETHEEAGQTFAEYHGHHAAGSIRPTLYLLLLGDFTSDERAIVDDVATAMAIFFDRPVRRLPPVSLAAVPAEAQRVNEDTGQPQIHTGWVRTSLLQPRRPEDAAALIALSATDLWPGEGWNFVFGEASLTERVGVWSLARLGDPTVRREKVLLRVLGTALHETGHMLGIPHCIAYECGMNGSNSLEESDRQPLAFCPECDTKVTWATGADPIARYRRLADWADREGLGAEAAFWRRSAERLASPP